LCQKDVEVCPPIVPLGPDYIRLLHDPGASTCFHFHLVLGFRHGTAPRKNSSAAELRSATTVTSHAIKSLELFRSKSANFEERKMDKAPVLDARTVWELSTVAEEQIQALADRGLLRPKTEVFWRTAAGEEFRTEGTGEIVVFLAQLKHGFSVPAGDFLCGLLFFYRIELVHLMPSSITIISTFIHLCEAYLGIALHFHLWRHFFELKKTGKGRDRWEHGLHAAAEHEVRIRRPRAPRKHGWKQGWFYIENPTSALPTRTGRAPVPYPEWTSRLTSRDTEELQPLLNDQEQLKAEGLIGGVVAISVCRRLIQPI
jgi:hypothetical protein